MRSTLRSVLSFRASTREAAPVVSNMPMKQDLSLVARSLAFCHNHLSVQAVGSAIRPRVRAERQEQVLRANLDIQSRAAGLWICASLGTYGRRGVVDRILSAAAGVRGPENERLLRGVGFALQYHDDVAGHLRINLSHSMLCTLDRSERRLRGSSILVATARREGQRSLCSRAPSTPGSQGKTTRLRRNTRGAAFPGAASPSDGFAGGSDQELEIGSVSIHIGDSSFRRKRHVVIMGTAHGARHCGRPASQKSGSIHRRSCAFASSCFILSLFSTREKPCLVAFAQNTYHFAARAIRGQNVGAAGYHVFDDVRSAVATAVRTTR